MNYKTLYLAKLILILTALAGCASDQTLYVEPLGPPGFRPLPTPFYGQPDGPGFGPPPPGPGFTPPPPPP
jgi:hypothetical protein